MTISKPCHGIADRMLDMDSAVILQAAENASGDANQAAAQAARDMARELIQERAGILASIREQHPQALSAQRKNSLRTGELGAFPPFVNNFEFDDEKFDKIIKDAGLTDEQIADYNAEVEAAQERAPLAGPMQYEIPTDAALKTAGLMAEDAYRPMGYEQNDDGNEQAIIRFESDGRSFKFVLMATDSTKSEFAAIPDELNHFGPGAAMSIRGAINSKGVSRGFAEAWNNRVAASADLMRRKFDLLSAVTPKAAQNVAKVWGQVAQLPGAFEFKRAASQSAMAPVSRLQQVADSVLDGTRYEATAKKGASNKYVLELEDRSTGDIAEGEVEFLSRPQPRLVMHTSNFDKGGSFGKAFYQVAFAFGHEMGIKTDADALGLTGVNSYRRTEQMMSAAARAGVAGAVNPGVGQRMYGWDSEAKSARAKRDNFVRIALTAARNAAELVPAVQNLRYDLQANTFSWRTAKRGVQMEANEIVRQALQNKDVRAVSISRATLARAAITFEALDGRMDLAGVTNVASPVLYSRRGGMFDGDGGAGETFTRPENWEPGKVKRVTLSDFSVGAQGIEAIQDRYNRWKQAIDQVAEQGGRITEENDFYRTEERYWGVVGAQTEDFGKELEKWVEGVAKDKLTLDDVALYAYAQHAEERNEWIAQKRPGMPDGGSGMPTEDAKAYLEEARQAGLEPQLQRQTAALRAFAQGTRDLMRDGGLLDQEEYAAWSNMFEMYVPLRGLEGRDEGGFGTGQGFSVSGPEGKTAKGRYSQARQIIEQIAQDRTKALIRVGKNEVDRSFLQFVMDNPSPNLWEVNKIERKPVTAIDDNGNRIIEEVNSVVADERTVSVKDGGKEIRILVHDKKLLEQMKNMHVENVGRLIGGLLTVNRTLSKLYTTLSPTFVVLNGARDFTAASIGIIDEIGFLGVPRLWANMPRSIMEAYRAEAGDYSADYQLYRATGGKTGFFDFKTLDQQGKDLATMLANAERPGYDPRKFGPKIMSFIEGMNGGIENATRLAAFKTARQVGKTTAEAASISKNITVNFNRKGTMTSQLSAWFLFFNPAVQGSSRIAQALKSPKVLAALGFAMGGVAALALRNAAMGDDDDGVAWWDKIPDETKERNLIIVLPPGASSGDAVPGSKTGRFVKVPMPYGYNFFAVVANQMVDVWRNSQDAKRGRGQSEATMKAVNAFLGAWMPASEIGRAVDNQKSLLLAAVPDAFNPIAQALANMNTFGRPMYPDDAHNKNMPDSTKYFPGQAGTLAQKAAEKLNALTGGSAYREGLIDVTPATLEGLARGYGGGPVSFTMDILNAIYLRQAIERPTLRMEALPFVKQLYGVIDAETDRAAGYQRMEKVGKITDPMAQAKRDGNAEEVMAILDENPEIATLGEVITRIRKDLSEVRKSELSVVADTTMSDVERYKEMQRLANDRREVLHQFSAIYDDALVKQAEGKRRKAQ